MSAVCVYHPGAGEKTGGSLMIHGRLVSPNERAPGSGRELLSKYMMESNRRIKSTSVFDGHTPTHVA